MKKKPHASLQDSVKGYLREISVAMFLQIQTDIYMLHKKTVLVKKRHFYVKKLFFKNKLNCCKNTAFLRKKAASLQVTWL